MTVGYRYHVTGAVTESQSDIFSRYDDDLLIVFGLLFKGKIAGDLLSGNGKNDPGAFDLQVGPCRKIYRYGTGTDDKGFINDSAGIIDGDGKGSGKSHARNIFNFHMSVDLTGKPRTCDDQQPLALGNADVIGGAVA